jgi:hypothetical protein
MSRAKTTVGLVFRRAAVAWLIVTATAALGQEAGPPRPAWQCLPEETFALVRLPGGRATVEAIAARTKLGAALFSPERARRRAAAWEEIVAENPDEGRFWRTLQEYGLEADDHTHLFDGEAGMAGVAPGRDGPLAMAIAWVEPGEAVAERMLAGIGRGLAETVEAETADGNAARRTDLEMAGRPVIWVQLPWKAVAPPDAAAGAADPQPTATGVLHLLVTRVGGRLAGAAAVAAQGALNLNMQVDGGGPRLAVAGKPGAAAADAAALARAEEVVGRVFERFLAAHDAADEPAAAVAALVDRGGGEAGTSPAIEAILRPLGFGADAGDVPLNRRLAPFGLDAVGPLVWRQWLDGTTWRSEISVSLPAPRHGLMRLLDERADAAEVPPFVTREPVGFHRVSLDLGRAYALLREALLAGEEPPPGSLFGAAETQSLALLGADLPTVLSALGTRHTVVWYPMQIEKIVERVRRTAENPQEQPPGTPDENPLAIVWELADEAPFRKLMQLATAGGGEVRDEQGFRIVRGRGVALALGQKHLVVAVGEGVAEKTLAAIRTPPVADAALADSPAHRRAAALVAAEPGGLYGVSDHARGGGTLGSIIAIAAGIARGGAGAAGDDAKGAAFMAALLPSAADIEGMLGASVVVWKSDGQGIVLRSATELPPP